MRVAVLCAALVAGSAVMAAPFEDVPTGHWAYAAVARAREAGVLLGIDGKFAGTRTVTRYEMAAVVRKLLDGLKAPGVKAAAVGDAQRLATEFAEELVLMDVRVSQLEGELGELKRESKREPADAGSWLRGFADVGLVLTDDMGGAGTVRTRFDDVGDSLYWTLPQVSLGIDKQVTREAFLHAQFDYASDVQDSGGTVFVNELYVSATDLGGYKGRAGAFALPLSFEHNGPFRTCRYTVTPSALNTFNESFRMYGVEFYGEGPVGWTLGFGSNTDRHGLRPVNSVGYFSDAPVGANFDQVELDAGIGFFVRLDGGKEREGKLGWSAAYVDNGGDTRAPLPWTPSPEIKYWQAGLSWWKDKLRVLGQYQDGSFSAVADEDWTMWYLLANFRLDRRHDVSVRYDAWDAESATEGSAWTLAVNRACGGGLLQLEWLDPKEEVGPDQDDQLVQLRWRVAF